MKLSEAQERMLVELAEPNQNDENEWRIGGRGKIATCESLVRLGLLKQHSSVSGRIFSLTDAGKARAAELV